MEEQQKTNNPHDKGYKRIFKIKKNFLDFIKKYVAMDWMAELTVDDIELVDKEFVTDQFETYESDFVYKIHVKNREVYMFFLQELQSKNDFSMPFRLLVYMTAIWLDYFKNADKKERIRKDFFFPPIFPLVLYNGKNRWTAKRSFKEMVKGGELLEEYVLDFKYQLISVNEIEPEFITNSNTLVDNILYADSFMDEKAWMKNAENLGKRLQALSREDMNAWLTWFQHAVQGLNTQRKEEMIEKIRNGDVGNMCNSFERVLNDVREEGREEGREEIIEQLKNGDVKNMYNLFERVLNDVREEEREHLVKSCYQKGKNPEVIAEFLDIPLEQVERMIGHIISEESVDEKK